MREPSWGTGQWRAVAKAEEEEEEEEKLWSVESRAFSFYWADSHAPPLLPPSTPTVCVCSLKAPIQFA